MVSVVILAAGLGTRMKSQTPKVLHKICGKSMIEYVIEESLQVSSDIHIILYSQKEAILHYLQSKYQSHILDKITFHTQPHHIYAGTGGALMNENKEMIALRGEKVLVVSGDTPLVKARDFEVLLQGEGVINLASFTTQNPTGYGRILQNADSIAKNFFLQRENENGFEIMGIIEEKDCTAEQKQICKVNGGIYCFQKEILQHYIPLLQNTNAQKEYYLTDIISLAEQGNAKIMAYSFDEKALMGVNTKVHLAQAQDSMLQHLRQKAMFAGVLMDMPESIYLDYDVEFEGECMLENGVRITGKSRIENSIIKAHSVIEESEIIASDIGPYAHIRPQSHISHSHIGNFVECKKAVLNEVKAGHLSYLGDCVIESGSNIGAGVITCNYDGKSKHQTKIGKNVFVGSDSQLVAPVTIEDNVLIAAGSTITQNVPQDSLAISRQKQKNIRDGFTRFFRKNDK